MEDIEMGNINNDENERFLQETIAIDQIITTLNENIKSLNNIQLQIIQSTSTHEEQKYTRAREPIAVSTKNLLFQVKDRIRNIERENLELAHKKNDIGLRKNQYARLKEKFSNTVNNFRTIEQTYRRLQEERIARQYVVVNPNASEQEIENFVKNSSNQLVFQDASLRSSEARAAAAEVQKRHNDIKNIEKTIEELVALTEQISLTIEEQEDFIKEIEKNVEVTDTNLHKTTSHLSSAQKHGISARRMKWIVASIIFLIIVIIVVLVIFLRPKN
ncbi:3481_t:CDS:1 [Ambispora leptoticha]|uniref:3481_t:CDS:1 n=1 Tax=Ambispora leptoticha TaxID=144679 RepID=A0A9N9AI93_9GLOM|nr:3481_t:CDS:1 [Ambispora leptoticha]